MTEALRNLRTSRTTDIVTASSSSENSRQMSAQSLAAGLGVRRSDSFHLRMKASSHVFRAANATVWIACNSRSSFNLCLRANPSEGGGAELRVA